jgi:aspartyl-tRNA(Asn)/glutamyl-tRNA(Gln) amidotransferase subunit A
VSLFEKSVLELSSMLKNKEISSVELTQTYLKRIQETDSKLNSFLKVDEEKAIAEATAADKTISASSHPLAGIPIAIKDIILTKGIRTSAASKILENFVPTYDATVVSKLKNVGAVMLGKTNCDEFAMGSSNENSAYGPSKNPWDTTRVPGGSSGGSASSVAGRQAPMSLGTDTGGSIRQPAALCGIVGLKPTYGRVSRFGVNAFASSLDQVGPMARTVEDTSILFDAISGFDDRDSTSSKKETIGVSTDYLKKDIRNLKIGVPKEYVNDKLDPAIRKNFDESLKQLESMGAKIETISLPHTDYAISCYYIVAPAEASSNLARYDGIRYTTRKGEDKGLNEIYVQSRSQGFGKEVQRRILLGTFVLSAGYYDAYYKKALDVRNAIRKDFSDAFQKVDVIATPTSPCEAFKIGEKSDNPMDMYLADVFTVATPLSENPALSVPCGFHNNLPLGLQLIGKHFDEKTILNAAYQFEQATGFYKKVPTL